MMDMRQFFNYWRGHSDRQREKIRIGAIFSIQIRRALNKQDIFMSDLFIEEQNTVGEMPGNEETKEEFIEKMADVNAAFDAALEKTSQIFTHDDLRKLEGK